MTEEQLQAYLDENPGDFRVEPRLTLRQVYFSSDRRGDATEQDALELLQTITADSQEGNLENFGDPLPLPAELNNLREGEIARLFGTIFTDGLRDLETGRWMGPVESGFGLHLVFIQQREDGRAPDLEEVRDAGVHQRQHCERRAIPPHT